MPNPKGNPQNFEPAPKKGTAPLTEQVSFRCTKELKERIQQQPDPPEFCRDAIKKALDERDSKDS
jgi:hypothetical protein